MQYAQSGMFPFCFLVFVFLFCFVLFSRIDFIVNFQLNSLALTMSTDGLVDRAPYLKPIWYKVTGSLSSRITSLWYLDNFLDKTFFLTTETLCDKIFSMLYTTFHIRKLLKLDGVTQFTEQKSGFTCFLDLEL